MLATPIRTALTLRLWGKSTLIRHVNRLIEPTAAEILVNGSDVLKMSREELRRFRRSTVAMVFQKFGLLPHRSVIDNAAYGLQVRGVDKQERLKEAEKWIETVGLSGYQNVRPRQLSGGQQQRVGLARALAMNTDIILMTKHFRRSILSSGRECRMNSSAFKKR